MSLSSAIAPHLPYLRRYARALAGDQSSGDAYVVAMLEALVADPSSFSESENPRTELYRIFSLIWNSVGVNRTPATAEPALSADRRLEAITPLPRQAFLLTAVESFAPEEAAKILGTDLDAFNTLIEEAGQQISAQVATEVLIIEDEPIIAMDLEMLMESLGHTVIGVARTHKEALAIIERRRPGLVLADMKLADGSSGLDAVNDILRTITVPVVFITAYPERLLTGDRPEPTFLITKPFQNDMVKAVASQALFFDTRAEAKIRKAS